MCEFYIALLAFREKEAAIFGSSLLGLVECVVGSDNPLCDHRIRFQK